MGYYCLYCKVGEEAKSIAFLEKKIKQKLKDDEYEFLFPQRIVMEKKKGKWNKVKRPLLPGYFFACSDCDLREIKPFMREIPNFYGCLHYSDGTCILRGSDAEYAVWAFSNEGVIQPSQFKLETNKKVKVISGPLKDMKGTIYKVEKKHMKVWVKIPFGDNIFKVSFAAEFLVSNEIE